MTPEHYLEFARYNAWANRRAAAMVRTLTKTQAARPLLLLSHLLRAERVWLGRIRGTEEATLMIWETDSLAVCQNRVETNTKLFETVVEELGPDLTQSVHYTNTKGAPFSTPLSGILNHVFNHSTHHRGQLALLVRDAGHVPEPLDLIAYLRRS